MWRRFLRWLRCDVGNRHHHAPRDRDPDQVLAEELCPFCYGDALHSLVTGAFFCVPCNEVWWTSPDACGVEVDPAKGSDLMWPWDYPDDGA